MRNLILLFTLISFNLSAQCKFDSTYNFELVRTTVFSRSTITIPVVVHVLYNQGVENISQSQIQSQIDILNKDFKGLNSETVPQEFRAVRGSMNVNFCLYEVVRVYTSVVTWQSNEFMKFTNRGGSDSKYQEKALNIWVCNLSSGISGYSTSPNSDSNVDGVVISYKYFGVTNNPPYNLGRTTTHEIGHFFNLPHIFGNSYCGEDWIDDTPKQVRPHYGCPNVTYNTTCGNHQEMTGNFMDYTDDRCMNMFTQGQCNVMINCLMTRRTKLANSNLCNVLALDTTSRYSDTIKLEKFKVTINQDITIKFESTNKEDCTINIIDLLGRIVYSRKEKVEVTGNVFTIPNQWNGIYLIQLVQGNKNYLTKLKL